MPKYSTRSQQKLLTVHQDLQVIFNQVIKEYDCTIVFGRRTTSEQFLLYQRGRKLVGDAWIIEDKKKVVTYKDGHCKRSKHQPPDGEVLSLAADVIPYHKKYPHIRWKDTKSLYHFSGYVRGVADTLKAYGEIEHDVVWGGDWRDSFALDENSFMDLVHFQLK